MIAVRVISCISWILFLQRHKAEWRSRASDPVEAFQSIAGGEAKDDGATVGAVAEETFLRLYRLGESLSPVTRPPTLMHYSTDEDMILM